MERKPPLPSLEALQQKLDAAQTEPEKSGEKKDSSASAMGDGMRLATEMVAGMLVGGALGYGVDIWLESSPWGLLAGVFLGIGAGLRNLMRAAK